MNTKTRRTCLFYELLITLVVSTMIYGCTRTENSNQDTILATINGFNLTLDEYESKLVREMEYNQEYKTTMKARQEFLNTLIKKEILIQEAVRLKLDQQPGFKNAIENYWEATLIKTLMEEKSEQIQKKTYLTENEVKAKYNQLKQKNASLPSFDLVEQQIAQTLKEEKKTLLLDQWIDGLTKNAAVHINHPLLKKSGDPENLNLSKIYSD